MTDKALLDPSLPARPPHVEERHVMVEAVRAIMLQQVADARFAAAGFETALILTPDHDKAVDDRVRTLETALSEMGKTIVLYRTIRDIQGLA